MEQRKIKEEIQRAFMLFKECSIYITTLTFSLLAIFRYSTFIGMRERLNIDIINLFNFSAATFCFLVPLVLEPALATLQHDFIASTCVTTSGRQFLLVLIITLYQENG